MITYVCEACKAKLNLPDELGRESGRCPACHSYQQLQGTRSVESWDYRAVYLFLELLRKGPGAGEHERYRYLPYVFVFFLNTCVLAIAVSPLLAFLNMHPLRPLCLPSPLGRPAGFGVWEALGFAIAMGLGYRLAHGFLHRSLMDLYEGVSQEGRTLVGFAKAGGLDISETVPQICILAVWCLFQLTLDAHDPIRQLRSPWLFVFLVMLTPYWMGMLAARWCFSRRFDYVEGRLTSDRIEGPVEAPAGPLSTAAAFSTDGRHIAVGDQDGSVRLWDRIAGNLLCVAGGHVASVTCLRFSEDGTQLATGAQDGTVRLWDAGQLRSLRLIDIGAPIVNVRFVQGVAQLAVLAAGRHVQFLDLHGTLLPSAPRPVDRCMTSTPDGMWTIAAGEDRSLRIYDPGCLEPRIVLRRPQAATGLLTGKGPHVVAIADGQKVQVWNLLTQTGRASLHLSGGIDRILAFEGDWLVAADDRHVQVWDWLEGSVLARLPASDKVLAASIDPRTSAVWVLEVGEAEHSPAVRHLPIAGV